MQLTSERISRYLQKQKVMNGYLLNLQSKNRDNLLLVSELAFLGFQLESKLRNLMEKLTAEETVEKNE